MFMRSGYYIWRAFVRSLFFFWGGVSCVFLLCLLSTVPSGGFCGSLAFLAFWLPAPRVFSAALEPYSDGALDAADGADITVADDQAAGVDDNSKKKQQHQQHQHHHSQHHQPHINASKTRSSRHRTAPTKQDPNFVSIMFFTKEKAPETFGTLY